VRSGGAGSARHARVRRGLPPRALTYTRKHVPGRPAPHAQVGPEVWFHAQASMNEVARHITLRAEGCHHASLRLQHSPMVGAEECRAKAKSQEVRQRGLCAQTSDQAGWPRTAGARIVEGDTVPAVARVHVHALHLEQVSAPRAVLQVGCADLLQSAERARL